MFTKLPLSVSYNTNYPRAILGGGLVGLIIVGLIYLFFPQITLESGINERVERAQLASCKVKDNAGSIGTGVLLDTGFVLTASHVVDDNGDGALQPEERDSTVYFFNDRGVASVHSASVVYLSSRDFLDFAILEVENAPESDVKLQLDYAKIGDEVYTIGCTRGLQPHLTYGRQSLRSGRHALYARASIPAYSGNSGGGVFNSDQEVLGVVSMVGIDRINNYIEVPIPTEHGIMVTLINAHYTVFMPSWVEYTRSQFIFLELNSLQLGFTVVKEPEYRDNSVLLTYLSMAGQIALVLLVTSVHYRYLR